MQLSPTTHAIILLRSLADLTTDTPSLGPCWLLNAALRLEGRTPTVRTAALPATEDAAPLTAAALRIAAATERADRIRALQYGVPYDRFNRAVLDAVRQGIR